MKLMNNNSKSQIGPIEFTTDSDIEIEKKSSNTNEARFSEGNEKELLIFKKSNLINNMNLSESDDVSTDELSQEDTSDSQEDEDVKKVEKINY